MCLTNQHPDTIRQDIMLNAGISLTFALDSVDISVFNPRQLNQACDALENRLGCYKLTILPPIEGEKRFEIHAEENGVVVNLKDVRKQLVEILEMMA